MQLHTQFIGDFNSEYTRIMLSENNVITEIALTWFKSYLSERKYVSVNTIVSDFQIKQCELLQGLCC